MKLKTEQQKYKKLHLQPSVFIVWLTGLCELGKLDQKQS